MGKSKRVRKYFDEFDEEKTDCNDNHTENSIEEERLLMKELSKVSITTDNPVTNIVNEDDIIGKIFTELPGKDDIQFKILSFLPLKSVFKFKLVSKYILRLIDEPPFAFAHARRLSSISPFTGLFYQCAGRWYSSNPPLFIPTNTDAGGLPDSSLSFLKEDENDDIKLIDSCNGLLLCRKSSNLRGTRKLYVCNPLTKQKVYVPHPWKRFSIDNPFVLIAQSISTGYQRFKVLGVHNYTPTFEEPCAKLWIFSSEICKWEEFKDRPLPVLSHSTMMGTKVVVKDTLFWDCFERHILVCHLNNNVSSAGCFDLIEAPKDQLGRNLWDYNGKLLCYCHGYDQYNDDFPVWSLCSKTNNKLGWEIENSEELRVLAKDVRNSYFNLVLQPEPTKVLPHVRFKIVAYHPNLKTMYLSVNNTVISYELAKGTSEWVSGLCSEKNYTESCVILQYVHSLERIETGGTQA